MSKKKAPKSPKPKSVPARSRRPRKAVMAVILVLALSLAGIILARWRSYHRTLNPLSPNPQSSPSVQLSKEYIYAGGRLVATEELGTSGPSPLPAPSGLVADGFSVPSYHVGLSWTASTGSGVDHYQVERCANVTIQNCYSVVGSVLASGSTITFTDTISGPTNTTAYLYRVRGANAGNTQFSDYTAPDLATAITFTDDPLEINATPIKAAHLIELRQAVNAVRSLAGLGSASWTYPDPVSNPPAQRRKIFLEDITEIRSQLDEALTILQRVQPYPADPPLVRGGKVSQAHFTQIRDRVK